MKIYVKACPLKFAHFGQKLRNDADASPEEFNCERKNCGWYDEECGMCSIAALAGALSHVDELLGLGNGK